MINSSNGKYDVNVRERWYTFPIPHIALGDRNFNEWWVDRNKSLKRLIYGVNFTQKNLTGRNDKLNLLIYDGFESQYKLSYNLPFIGRRKNLGFFASCGLQLNKILAVKTEYNKLLYLRDEDYLRQSQFIELGISYQPNAFFKQQMAFAVQRINVVNNVKTLNELYILNDETDIINSITYDATYDRRDIKGYAWNGPLFNLLLESYQTNFNPKNYLNRLTAKWVQHIQLSERLSLAQVEILRLSSKQKQSYYLQQGLGWNNQLLRSYGYYVIDGQDFWLQKHELRLKLKEHIFKLNVKRLNLDFLYPIAIIPKIFLDMGYVNDKQFENYGELANELLIGFGAGLDIVSFSDNVLRIEYGWNIHRKPGLFINFNTAIQ